MSDRIDTCLPDSYSAVRRVTRAPAFSPQRWDYPLPPPPEIPARNQAPGAGGTCPPGSNPVEICYREQEEAPGAPDQVPASLRVPGYREDR